jgi:uncharacterized protein YbjT (DUF2867 family)
VDFHYVLNVARLGLAMDAKRFFAVSSVSANPQSRIFYSRVKGEMEQAIRMLTYDSVHIFRPSLILGHRQDRRPGERLGQLLAPLMSPLLRGGLRKYRPAPAGAIAETIVQQASQSRDGFNVYEGVF